MDYEGKLILPDKVAVSEGTIETKDSLRIHDKENYLQAVVNISAHDKIEDELVIYLDAPLSIKEEIEESINLPNLLHDDAT